MNETADTGETSESDAPPRRRRWGWRIAAVILLLPLVLLAGAAVALLGRDIPAPDWVIAEIEERAAENLSGGRLDVGDISVNLGRDLHPRVQLADTTLRDATGAPVARIPIIEGLFSPRGVVFKREALMQDLRIGGAQVNLRRAQDGSVALSFQAGTSAVEAAPSFLDLLDQFDTVFDLSALAALETIRADGLVVNYQDARAGRTWTVDGGTLLLDVRGNTTRIESDLTVLSGGAGITSFSLTYSSPRGSRAADFELDIIDARAADIAAQSPALSWLADVDAPLTARMTTSRNEDGTLAPLVANLALGAGALQPNAATDPIGFERAVVNLQFDPEASLITFDEVAVTGDLGVVNASGQAFFTPMPDGLPQSLTGQFTLKNSVVNPSELVPTGIEIPLAQVDARLNLQPFTVELGQLYTELSDVSLLGRGRLAATEEGWDLGFDIKTPEITQASLMRLWPETALPGTRRWLNRAVGAAQYKDVNISVRRGSDGVQRHAGSFAFADLGLTYLGRMPPLQDGRGTAVFTDQDFAVALENGFITPPDAAAIDVAGSSMFIPDVTVPERTAIYDLRASGEIPDLLALIDQPPMVFITNAGLSTDVAEGTAIVELDLQHPIKDGMTGQDISFRARADLRNVSSDDLIPQRSLSAASLALAVTKETLTVTGAARVDGIPINGTWTQSFRGQEAGSLRSTIQLTDARIRRFGIDLPPGSVAGEGSADFRLILPRGGGAPRYQLTSDLRGLQVAVPAVGWAKPANTAGRLNVAGRLGSDPQVETLEISGGGLDVRGDVTFNPNGGLGRARLSRVQIGNWLNAPITLRGRGPGRPLGVSIEGGTIDLRRASFGSGGGESGPISIALDRLQVTEGIALNRFAGEFTSAGGFAGEFTALINNVGQVRGTVAPSNGRSAVRILSSDAGGVGLATGLIRNAVGGSLDLTLLPTGGDGTFDGRLAIRNLRIRDAPTMAALLDAISVVGLLQQLDGQGLSFEEVDARFRLTPTQVIVTESSAVGPGLGISLDGIYTLASQQMDFQGVVSPFYLINSIGSVLTRRGEGLIGFNFTIGGTASAPQVGVNPLSAFTPGMFRDIFRRSPPQVSQ